MGRCACVQDPRFEEIVKDLQLESRGTGGEHTTNVDDVYDISNRARLKKSEVGRLHHAVSHHSRLNYTATKTTNIILLFCRIFR